MTPTIRRRLWLALLILILGGLFAYAFVPRPVEIDIVEAQEGALQISIDEDGKTRVKERYTLAAPLAGRLLRIDLDPGDPVEAGQTMLALVEPAVPALLDERTLAQSEARVKAAEAALSRSLANQNSADQRRRQAEANLQRRQKLFDQQMISRQEFDDASYASQTAREDHRAALFAVQIARAELTQANAALLRLRELRPGQPQDAFPLLAPADGQVLRVLQESATVVTPGTPLVEVGNAKDLEVVIDVLSSDAVRIRPGQRVLLEQWGGGEALRGRVRLVEPAAYTKVSALGVEEQRVDVVVDLEAPPDSRPTLGDGYRVEARIIVWEKDKVQKVPSGALFRREGQWAVFVVDGNRARLRPLTTGQSNGLETEVLAGLEAAERVILHPGDKVDEGVRVQVRR